MFWSFFQLNGTRRITLRIISKHPDVIWLIANPHTRCVPDMQENVSDTKAYQKNYTPLRY